MIPIVEYSSLRSSLLKKSSWLTTVGKNEALPGVVPIESYSYTFSDDCRDDEAITATSIGDTSRISSCDIYIHPTRDDDLFGFKASWERHFHESQIKIDDQVTTIVTKKKGSSNKTTPQSKSKKKNQQSKSRFDKWSKGLKMSNPYKYQSISNDLFVGTENDDVFQLKKSRASLAHSSLESRKEKNIFTTTLTHIDDRDEFHMNDNRSEINTRDQRQQIEEFSTYDNRSILDNEMFQTNNNDSDHSRRSRESTSNEPLLHSNGTILQQSIQDIPSQQNNYSSPTDFEASSSCDIQLSLPLSSTVRKDIVLNKIAIYDPIVEISTNNKSNSSIDEESLPPPPPEEEIKGLDSDDEEDSAYLIENVEKRPLLMKMGSIVDCNRCGRTSRKNILPKKKKAEGKKKKSEDNFQFYWKYESMENSEKDTSHDYGSAIARRSEKRKEELDELDHIISRIDPENSSFFVMPIGIQLSTITEYDEDLTPSSRSQRTAITTTLASGSIQQDGGVTLDNIGNLLPTSKESVESRSEVIYTDSPDFDPIQHINSKQKEEVDMRPQQQQAIGFDKDVSKKNEVKTKSERSKLSKREKRDVILRNNEVVIPVALSGDDSSDTSNGQISDITEDYLQIPFSSPLYRKVLMAFQEASKEKEAEAEQIKFKKLFKNIQSAKNIQSEIEEDNSNEELNHLTTVALYSESNSTDELNHLATVAF
jgi:hypothetical protein